LTDNLVHSITLNFEKESKQNEYEKSNTNGKL